MTFLNTLMLVVTECDYLFPQNPLRQKVQGQITQHESMGMKFHVNHIRNMEEVVSLYASGQPTHD